METSMDPNIETAISAGENTLPLVRDEMNSVLGNEKFAKEGTSTSCKPGFVSNQFTKLLHSDSAKSSPDKTSRDQPSTDSKMDRCSSVIDRKPSTGEDSAAMTIEFLRARLSSERTISRSAKRQIEELSKKVTELEGNLQAEMEKRKLSQFVAEEASRKLEDAGVHLDSTQLDAFVRVLDLGNGAHTYQDASMVNSPHSESFAKTCTRPHQSECDVRVSEDPKSNGQRNYSNATEADQITSAVSNPRDLGLEKDRDEKKEDNPLSTGSRSSPSVLVRGIGRSCRTFKKRPTSVDTDETLVESWNDLGKDGAYLSQNLDQEEPEGSDLSGWINSVVDILDHDYQRNFSSSLEDDRTDYLKQGAEFLNSNAKQCDLKKDAYSPHDNHEVELDSLDDTSSAHLSVQAVVSYSIQNARQSDEVKKLLEHREELIAWSRSEENAQTLWEQQHPFQSTSEQEQAINDPGLRSCALQADNPHENDSVGGNKKQEYLKSVSEEPVRVLEAIKELQGVQQCSPNTLSKQTQSDSSKLWQVTTIAPSEEQNLAHSMNPANSGSDVPINRSDRAVPTYGSVDFSALDLNQPETSDIQGQSLPLRPEHKPSRSSMEAQSDENGTLLMCTTEVKYCTHDAEICEGMWRQLAGPSIEVSSRHSYSQDYGNSSESCSNNSGGVDSKAAISEEPSVGGNAQGDDPWDGLPLKIDLQKQALHHTGTVEPFIDDHASHVLRNSKKEFPKYMASNSGGKGKYLWEPSRRYDPYKAMSHENATGAKYGRSDKAFLRKHQVHPQTLSISNQISPWKHADISSTPYEQTIERKYKAVNSIQREETNPSLFFMPMSEHDRLQAHDAQHPSALKPSMHIPNDKLQHVLRGLRVAKEQLKVPIEQRQLLSEYSKAKNEDFYRDHSNFCYNYPLVSDVLNPPLGYPAIVQDQRGFHGLESRLNNYAPSLSSALDDGFRYHPPPSRAHYMLRHGPLSQEPASSYVDKLNVVKGIDFCFKH